MNEKVYELVESQEQDLGDWGNDLSDEQIKDAAKSYDRIERESLSKEFPEIEFITVNYGQTYQAHSRNEEMEENDSIKSFIEKNFETWLTKALEENNI